MYMMYVNKFMFYILHVNGFASENAIHGFKIHLSICIIFFMLLDPAAVASETKTVLSFRLFINAD